MADAAAVTRAAGQQQDLKASVSKPYSMDPIRDEVDRIEESARESAQGQFEHAKFWRRVNIGAGAPASLLAALSAGTGLASVGLRVLAAALALLAAGLGAAMTTLNPSRRVAQAQTWATAYLALQTTARQLRTIDLPVRTPDEARAALKEISARSDELNQVADPPGRGAYKRGQRNLREGGQTYAVDSRAAQDKTV